MICTNLRDAKASLNRLVDRAIQGDDVVIMRGSKPVAAIVPISEADMCLNFSAATVGKIKALAENSVVHTSKNLVTEK